MCEVVDAKGGDGRMPEAIEVVTQRGPLGGFELADDLHAWVGGGVPFYRYSTKALQFLGRVMVRGETSM